MTHVELVESLELERQDVTFWRLPAPAKWRDDAERDRMLAEAVLPDEPHVIQSRVRALLGAVGELAGVVHTVIPACEHLWTPPWEKQRSA